MSIVARLRHRAGNRWIALTSSLWFIPSAIVALAIVLALTLVEISARIDAEMLARLPRLFGAGAAGSRGMLSTIAGSVITVAGVTFSITIAALALASAQYTPRVLRTFMADRSNQIVLGTFVGVYVYCLVVLRTIRGGDEGSFVPSIAVLVGFVLAVVSVGVLIFFIHHIAGALQASTILDRVRRTTERTIAELFPEEVGDPAEPDDEGEYASGAGGDAAWWPVASETTGYLQSVDVDALVAFARNERVVVRMEASVGRFVTAGTAIVSVTRSTDEADSKPIGSDAIGEFTPRLNGLFTINAHRTVEQDAAFGILQIVDIALKALSPGINDTTTAVTCVDHLGALLACLAPRRIVPRARTDGTHLRVIVAGLTFANLVSLAFDDIRRNAAGNVTVLHRLFDGIRTAAQFTRDSARCGVLALQVELVAEVADRSVPAPSDRALLAERAREARLALRLAAPPPLSAAAQ
jgi:uncharacterized membrane protein